VRGGQAEPLTEDHTLVNQWVREGILSSQQAKDHHQSHVITQSIGNPEGVELESRWEEIRPGDVIVLCSDGLHGIVSDQEIAQTVSYIDNSQRICEALVDMANDKGGPDNISIITIQIEQVMPEPEPATFPSIPLPTGFGVRSNDEGVPIPQVHTPQLPQGRVHKSLSARTPSMRSIRKKKQTDTAKRKALRPRKERPIILWASALIPVALALGTILGVILSQAFSSDTTDLALRQQVDALRTQVATLQSLDSPTPSAITGVHTPTAALTQTITSTLPKTQITGVMKITTWLYDRPDYTASTTVQAHSDQQVTVLGRTEEKIRDVFWVLVLLDDERQGWIDANVTVIELPVPPKDLPIATPPLP